jgi:hypothetical protein
MILQSFAGKGWIVTGITAVGLAVSCPPGRVVAQPYDDHRPMAHAMSSHAPMGPVKRLSPKRVVTVTGNEDWEALRGFGKDSDMVAMRTLMMVGGSGMEHMKMGPMKKGGMQMAASGAMNQPQGLPLAVTVTPNPPVVGDNTLDIAVTDASGKPVTGLKLTAAVAMTSMDMGTVHPKIVEGQGGHYTAVVNFSMKGPWRVSLSGSAPGSDKTGAVRTALDFNVGSTEKWGQPAGPKMSLNTPPDALKVGKNTLQFTILDAAGKPLTGAKVTTAVAMTNMDMGTAHPQAREGKGGRYTTGVEFSMAGPWRVTLTVTPPNRVPPGGRVMPLTRSFDFHVKE